MRDGDLEADKTPYLARLIEAFRRFADTVAEAIEVLARHIQPDLEHLCVWVRQYTERCRRERLVHALHRYRVPERVAILIAHWWPARWLPGFALPPPWNQFSLSLLTGANAICYVLIVFRC